MSEPDEPVFIAGRIRIGPPGDGESYQEEDGDA